MTPRRNRSSRHEPAARPEPEELLLGEWACLGIVAKAPTHGFAVAARLRPDADIGRVWSLSRALTYRSLDQLTARGLIEAIGEERSDAGPKRTVLAASGRGREAFERWLHTPVEHVRDLRSELLLKIVFAEEHGADIGDLLDAQCRRLREFLAALDADVDNTDVVHLWRREAAAGALRFLERLAR